MNNLKASEADALLSVLRQSVDPDSVAAIEALVRTGTDRALNRIDALDFASKAKLDEGRVIGAFLHAARVGLFDLSWNVLCPGCSGVLDANTSLKTIHAEDYSCALCGAGYEPTLDEMVEVSFTVSPRVRCRWRIGPTRGLSRACGLPARASMHCWASADRSSLPSAYSLIRRSVTSIGRTHSMSTSG